jgi:diguanylate cyclase (GGDEF)-like protein/PAS domain S-box-containing protein
MTVQENARVLVVEDESLAGAMMQGLLEKYGYTVVGRAMDGQQAVEMTQALCPDVVLMDIGLPDIDGIEATRLIQEHCPTPVVMLTAHDTPEMVEQASAAGAGAYLVKPTDPHEIERAITITIGRFGDMMELRSLNAELQAEIAERKRAEEALRESEARYRAVVEDQTELICRFQPDGTLTFVNEAYCHYFDKTQEELLGHTCMPLIPEEDQEIVGRQMAALSVENPIGSYEHRVMKPSGEIRWQQWTDRAIFDEHGCLAECQSVGRDITERKRAEEAIRRHSAELETLQRSSLQLTSSLDLSAVLDSICDGALSLVGATDCHIYLYDQASEMFTLGVALWEDGRRGAAVEMPRRDGLSATVAREGRSIVINDALQHPLYTTPGTTKWGLQAIAGFPLKRAERVLGVFTVAFLKPHTFSEEELRVLGLLAGQAAIAIENARLFEETSQRGEELAALNAISQDITSSLDLDETLQRIVDSTRRLTGARRSRILLINPQARLVLRDVISGYPPEEKGTYDYERFKQGISGWVICHKQSALVPDVLADERSTGPSRDASARRGTKSVVVSPLMVRGEVIGTLTAVNLREDPVFTLEDMALVEQLASQAAIAIENARLFEEIEERRMYLEGVLGAAPDAIVTLDAHHRIVEWNSGAERLFGYSRAEVIGLDLDPLVTNPDTFEEAVGLTQEVISGKVLPPVETIRYRKDGSHVHVIVAGSPILVGGELIGIVAVYTDITARKRMEETLRALALIDELTGLYNRRGFLTLAQQQLKMANRAKRRMLLLFADFDDLKRVNDTFGHVKGDQALIEIANVLRESFRESDIIARIAGDEFVVLATEISGTSAETIATRLQENLEVRNARRARLYKLSLSVGIAHYDPEHPCSIDDLMAQADTVMYEHKRGNQKS